MMTLCIRCAETNTLLAYKRGSLAELQPLFRRLSTNQSVVCHFIPTWGTPG